MSAIEDDKYLPGGPSKLLVRRVRSHLSLYGIRPKREPWRLTWEWANEIANSYWSTTRKHWPFVTEIATQYLVLVLARMKESGSLRLPFRAEKMPVRVRQMLRLPAGSRLALPQFGSQIDQPSDP
jgi:hypothetical protein